MAWGAFDEPQCEHNMSYAWSLCDNAGVCNAPISLSGDVLQAESSSVSLVPGRRSELGS